MSRRGAGVRSDGDGEPSGDGLPPDSERRWPTADGDGERDASVGASGERGAGVRASGRPSAPLGTRRPRPVGARTAERAVEP
ncbi:MAG: hypothetical protein QM713_11595 [Arachnia sp.]